MLSRSYQSVTPHNRTPLAEDDSTAVRVENYSSLVGAVYDLVTQGKEAGVVRLHNYADEDVQGDLTRACDEISHEDPLGAYAVDGIKHSYKRIVSYYEATISITYRRTAEQIASVVTVTGSGAIRGEVQAMLLDFEGELALRMNYFNEDVDYLQALVRQAYYDTPAAAFGMPAVEINLYPSEGVRRIIEIVLTHPSGDTPDQRRTKSAALVAAAQTMAEPYQKPGSSGAPQLADLFEALRAKNQLGENSGTTAYAALVEGSADSEGAALAFKLLCSVVGVECTVVEGTLDGAPHFWTIAALSDTHRHVDPSREAGFLLTDVEVEGLGYDWARGEYPTCGETEGLEPAL